MLPRGVSHGASSPSTVLKILPVQKPGNYVQNNSDAGWLGQEVSVLEPEPLTDT